MKRLKYYFFLPVSIVLILISCAKSSSVNTDTSGNWLKRSEFDGNARTGAASFVIGDTAYLGTGYDGTNRYVDFWAYDPVQNFWTQHAQFPGSARNSAVGFSIGTFGYIATGYDGLNMLGDTYQFSQASNSWTRKADFAGTPRYGAVAFGIGTNGYICSGFDGGYTKDLWQFSPTTGANGTWVQKVSLGGSKRSGAIAWVYNNKGYVLTGINNGVEVYDFWSYDPSTSTWTQLRDISNTSTDSYDDDYTDIVRDNGVGMVIGTKGYVAVGENGAYTKKTWEYDFPTDLWVRKTPYERQQRIGAVSFSLLGRAFVATGQNSTYYFDDIDEWQPNVTYNAND